MNMSDPSPAILVLDDEPSSVNLLRITLGMDYQVHTATDGPTALEILAQHPDIAVALIDQRMPGMTGTEFIQQTIDPYPHLVRIILTGYTDVDSLIEAINAGSVYRYITKPWNKDELLMTVRQGAEVHRLAIDNIRLQEELREANALLRRENADLRREVRGHFAFEEILGRSPALRRVLDLVAKAVDSDATVLITGATGTGKELIARALHFNGPRSGEPFLSVNCADFTPELLGSELFGHKKGAFTGATDERQGLFRAADGGTVFLDEIGDCPDTVQTRLLRFLDQGEIRRVGDDRPSRVDVRVIAATNRDIQADVKEGKFRKDLFFRLNVFTVHLPPLSERLEDVPILAEHFLDRFQATGRKRVGRLTPETIAALRGHTFDGNIRELENIVERAYTLADPGADLTPDLLPEAISGMLPATLEGAEANGKLRGALEQFEAQLIREGLQQHAGNQTRTAEALGISRRALIDKLQKYGIR